MAEDRTTVEGYCVKCRRRSEMVNVEEVTMSNGKGALRGRCRTCGTGMYKILGSRPAPSA